MHVAVEQVTVQTNLPLCDETLHVTYMTLFEQLIGLESDGHKFASELFWRLFVLIYLCESCKSPFFFFLNASPFLNGCSGLYLHLSLDACSLRKVTVEYL